MSSRRLVSRLILGAVLCGLSGPLCARALGAEPEPVLVIAWPRAALEAWSDADGVLGRRFFDLCRRDGWILRPEELTAEETAALDFAAARAGDDLLWRVGPGPANGYYPLGAGDGEVALRWEGTLPPGEPERLGSESVAWLASARRIRWEEVVEMLDLTAGENRAFQLQRDGLGPFSPLRAAFLRDKSGSNLAIYLAGTRRPRALCWRLELSRAYEETIPPLAATLRAEAAAAGPRAAEAVDPADPSRRDAAARQLFARRLLASRSRIYGRVDRILQSLAAEAPRGALLIVDGRASDDPFVAVLRADQHLGPAAARGERWWRWLREALSA